MSEIIQVITVRGTGTATQIGAGHAVSGFGLVQHADGRRPQAGRRDRRRSRSNRH